MIAVLQLSFRIVLFRLHIIYNIWLQKYNVSNVSPKPQMSCHKIQFRLIILHCNALCFYWSTMGSTRNQLRTKLNWASPIQVISFEYSQHSKLFSNAAERSIELFGFSFCPSFTLDSTLYLQQFSLLLDKGGLFINCNINFINPAPVSTQQNTLQHWYPQSCGACVG